MQPAFSAFSNSASSCLLLTRFVADSTADSRAPRQDDAPEGSILRRRRDSPWLCTLTAEDKHVSVYPATHPTAFGRRRRLRQVRVLAVCGFYDMCFLGPKQSLLASVDVGSRGGWFI